MCDESIERFYRCSRWDCFRSLTQAHFEREVWNYALLKLRKTLQAVYEMLTWLDENMWRIHVEGREGERGLFVARQGQRAAGKRERSARRREARKRMCEAILVIGRSKHWIFSLPLYSPYSLSLSLFLWQARSWLPAYSLAFALNLRRNSASWVAAMSVHDPRCGYGKESSKWHSMCLHATLFLCMSVQIIGTWMDKKSVQSGYMSHVRVNSWQLEKGDCCLVDEENGWGDASGGGSRRRERERERGEWRAQTTGVDKGSENGVHWW